MSEKAKWEIDLPLFEPEIGAFERSDMREPPLQSGVLFTGSSSIRMWPDLAETFAPWPVLNRGFGGSSTIHSALFARRIIGPHLPRAVVFYAGDNDLESGLLPRQVAADFARFSGEVFQMLPTAKFAVISVKPSPYRATLIGEIRQTNELIRQQIEADERLFFLDIFPEMLGENAAPRPELYAPDGVHLSPQGYELWTKFVRAFLQGEVC